MYQPMHQGPMKAMQKPVGGPVAAPAADPNAEEPRTFLNRQPMVFDGKRMRKAVIRKTIDYNSCVVKFLENRKWFKHLDSRHGIQPDEAYAAEGVIEGSTYNAVWDPKQEMARAKVLKLHDGNKGKRVAEYTYRHDNNEYNSFRYTDWSGP
ncbi:predicted protein [Nematostella vectensis]|uniref:Uncharacterized protein n=1 Tax=Nematostella vectensis TaxID=45351 RepID=A7S5J3_NEMVE|nr:predicted protein [Nematostella vectensis]|eukprot:XP_001633048.1 predicted protein [Nematostella vectensis]